MVLSLQREHFACDLYTPPLPPPQGVAVLCARRSLVQTARRLVRVWGKKNRLHLLSGVRH